MTAENLIDKDDLPEAFLSVREGTSKSFLGEVAFRREEVTFTYGEKGHTEQVPAGFSADEFIALGLALKATKRVDEGQVAAMTMLALPVLARHGWLSLGGDDEDKAATTKVMRDLLATGRIEVKP